MRDTVLGRISLLLMAGALPAGALFAQAAAAPLGWLGGLGCCHTLRMLVRFGGATLVIRWSCSRGLHGNR